MLPTSLLRWSCDSKGQTSVTIPNFDSSYYNLELNLMFFWYTTKGIGLLVFHIYNTTLLFGLQILKSEFEKNNIEVKLFELK